MIRLKQMCVLALIFCAGNLTGLQVPIPGTEDVPQLMAVSPLVCRGEVVQLLGSVERQNRSPGQVAALVKVDRFYKGAGSANPVQVMFTDMLDPLFTGLTLKVGEHALLFLKPANGSYVFADPYFGKLVVPRQLAAQGEGSLDSLQMLERDLEAALISG